MNKIKDKLANYGFISIIILFILIPIILTYGWINNLVKFTKLDFKTPYKAEIIRGIGLSPLGTIIGLVKIEDK